MDKRKKHKAIKHTLSSMQEVTYQHEFKMADNAAGKKNNAGQKEPTILD